MPPPSYFSSGRVGKGNNKKRKSGADTIAEILAMAERLNLLGPLGIDFDIDRTHAGGSFEASLFMSLHERCVKAWDVPSQASHVTHMV